MKRRESLFGATVPATLTKYLMYRSRATANWMGKLASRLLVFIALTGFVVCAQAAPEAEQKPEAVAERAYLYGLQQAIFYGQRWIYTQNDAETNDIYSGLNRFFWVRKQITPDFPVVTPNATTLYGSGFLDLRDGPVVIEVPEITDRYFSVQIMDPYGIFRIIVGSPFNGTKARKYILVPPGFEGNVPADFPTTDIMQWPSKTAYGVVRMAVKTGSDSEIATINAYQDQVTVTPLADWLSNGNKGIAQADRDIVPGDFVVPAGLPDYSVGQVDKQTAEQFFTLLNVILNDATMPVLEDSLLESQMLAQLRSIGIGKGLTFDWEKMTADQQAALEAGFKAGFENVRKTLKSNLINMNGWGIVRNDGGFETKWMDRAVIADAAWAAPDKNISHGGAFLFTDADGKPLSGANKYTMTFDMNDLPPVTQFWSIPIYDANGYFVANEINRYTVNSFMLDAGDLVVKDGKLVIYVQNAKPTDPDQAKNWLPAPKEGFRFTSRYYGPYAPLTNGTYNMPKVVRVK
ncbi:DUF1254 domain-containing protein [Marinobacter sediminum]|uniref:DUF1254 domain-containing protein n=1 Tax=Marinobacter sediminum TaxID=256323 RepID=UPI00202F4DDA|nr:DUF1254 domain-containing protein [Marinobacter sediminum]MCM0612072.1 DUF1254 domain-containing protein [Marinobacter sediminum]